MNDVNNTDLAKGKKMTEEKDLKVTDLSIYEGLSKVYGLMNRLIGQFHPEVSDFHDKIGIVFKDKTSKSGGKYVLANVAKAPPILRLLGKKDYLYLFYISDEAWGLMNESQQEALIDRCLCAVKSKYDEKAEDTKYLILKADVIAYKQELARHGYWWREIEEKLEELHKKPEDDEEGEEENQRMTSPTEAIDEGKVEDILAKIAEI